MNSPITGQPMELVKEKRTLEFRREKFEIVYQYFRCNETGEGFVNVTLGDLNLGQVYNAYRAKHNIPFQEEIRDIRSRYDLPATTMSQILGFGVNQYGLYEKGEIPSETNARIIQMAAWPEDFRRLVELSDVAQKQKEKIYKRLAELENQGNGWRLFHEKSLGLASPSEYNGFRKTSPEKAYHIARFFAEHQTLLKTALNKLFFYADFYHFKRFGAGISGLQYRAIQWGPVPSQFDTLFNQAEEKNVINLRYEVWDGDKEMVIIEPSAETSFKKELFTTEELSSLHAVLEKLKNLKTGKLVDISHREPAWKENIEGKRLISYNYAFDLLAL
jgi:uncharacterized phage-associated protein